MVLAQSFQIGGTYEIYHKGNFRVVKIVAINHEKPFNKRAWSYMTVSRIQDGKIVYRNYRLQDVEVY